MPAFSKPLKRKRQEDDTSNELERLRSEVKEMRELVKSVRSRKQFNPGTFVSRKKKDAVARRNPKNARPCTCADIARV